MKRKKLGLKITIVAIIALVGIGLMQYGRVGNVNTLLSPVQSSSEAFPVMSGSGETVPEGEELTVYMIQDESQLSQSVYGNLKHSLDYAKITNETISPQDVAGLSPSPYNVLVLTGEESGQWPYEEIRSFVEEGGRLFLPNRFLNRDWNELKGIEYNDGFSQEDVYGLKFEKDLFPGYTDTDDKDELFVHSMLEVELTSATETWATAEDIPLLWTHDYGEGKVVNWNTTAMETKNTRGLLLQSLSLSSPAFVSTQLAAKVFFIDDFPSPVPSGTNPAVYDEYGMDIDEFYKKIWWEDMKELSRKHDVTYSAAMIGTYREDDELLSDQLIANFREEMTFYGRELLEIGGEIGLHGYNHQSLVTAEEPIKESLGYTPWKDKSTMKAALTEFEELYEHYFPNHTITSYVPPSNVLNETGSSAVLEEIEHLETIASLYTGNPDDGDYVQEFGADKELDHITHFPRVTSDYSFGDARMFEMNDAIANFGVVSHFIHPDDILDPERASVDGWPAMKKNFAKILEKLDSNYPYLESLTVSEAAEKLEKYEKAEVDVRYTEEAILISGEKILDPSVMLIRLEDGKSIQTKEYEFGKVEELKGSSNVYVLTLTEPDAEIPITEGDIQK